MDSEAITKFCGFDYLFYILRNNSNFIETMQDEYPHPKPVPLRSYPKKTVLFPILMAVALMFCTNQTDYALEIHYQVPELHFDGKRSKELGITYAQFASSGEPFTGTQKVYYTENDSLYMELFFDDGINIGSVMYKDGNVIRQSHTLSNSHHPREMYVNDVLIYQDIPPSKTEDRMGHARQWHKNGQLSFEAYYTGERVWQGLMTEYDKEGNIIKQERYEDGELVEKIIK